MNTSQSPDLGQQSPRGFSKHIFYDTPIFFQNVDTAQLVYPVLNSYNALKFLTTHGNIS